MIDVKCNECGHTISIEKAKREWIFTKNCNVYCPNCIIRLNTKLKAKNGRT